MENKDKKYKLQDIKDYILNYYGANWKNFKVYTNFEERDIEESDFDEDFLDITIVVTQNGEQKHAWLTVNNECLRVRGINPKQKRNWFTWKEFLDKRYNQEQGLNK